MRLVSSYAASDEQKVRWVMKQIMMTLILLGFSATTLIVARPMQDDPSANTQASFGDGDYFYSALSPYGEWLELDAGFHAWRPTHVGYGWRPYLHGRWSWTDYGWYWMSSEPFGWATFHYGRWYYDDNYGWVWIPDRTWGPAWVEWRYNDDYLGWAPLPPYASFNVGVGIRFTTRWFAPYHYWNFVPYRYLASPYVFREVLPMEHARRLISMTRSAGRYDFEGGRIINRGIDREIVERRGGYTRIDRIEVRPSAAIGERFTRDRNMQGIEVYRPDLSGVGRTHERIDARHVERGTSLDLQRVERSPGMGPRVPVAGDALRDRRIQKEESQTPRLPPVERKEIERRKEDRYPFPRNEIAVVPRNREQRVMVPDKSVRENRREISQPRAQRQETRSAPHFKQESPRRSAQGRKEGARRRD